MPLFEVERKFTFALASLPIFRHNLGSPPFHSFRLLRPYSFTDIYYDTHSVLSGFGLWLRKRDGQWQAKKRVYGTSFDNTTFHETADAKEITELVRQIIPHASGPHDDFGLDVLARFKTERETAIVDGQFTVCLDRTNFGWSGGEVEVLAEENEADRVRKQIEQMMSKYGWFFKREKVTGKLSAYFENERVKGLGD